MDSVYFRNKGLIDPRCITTIGVSVKETENPIGFFGTGLKYAIAIILRHGGSITVWSGLERFDFTTKEIEIRGSKMQIVCMNDQELGFTTQLGKHWKVWQAMREIYCNTIDENGEHGLSEMPPSSNTTTICVSLEEFAECYSNIGKYILDTSPIYQDKEMDFHPDPSHSVFYRTIRVIDTWSDKPFLFTPNLQEKIDLTEDRTAKDQWQIRSRLAYAILRCQDEKFLGRWLTAGTEFAEYRIDLDWPETPSPAFLRVVADLALDTSRSLNLSALKVLAKHQPIPDPIEAELIEIEEAALQKSIKFCRDLRYTVNEFRIIVVESLGPNTLGRADVDLRHIYLARRAILMGDLTLSATLIEEWAHIKHGFQDCERNMQNWLFEQVTRLGSAYLSKIKT